MADQEAEKAKSAPATDSKDAIGAAPAVACKFLKEDVILEMDACYLLTVVAATKKGH